jgi:hypothetical protein
MHANLKDPSGRIHMIFFNFVYNMLFSLPDKLGTKFKVCHKQKLLLLLKKSIQPQTSFTIDKKKDGRF